MPVQPMKTIAAVALSQAALTVPQVRPGGGAGGVDATTVWAHDLCAVRPRAAQSPPCTTHPRPLVLPSGAGAHLPALRAMACRPCETSRPSRIHREEVLPVWRHVPALVLPSCAADHGRRHLCQRVRAGAGGHGRFLAGQQVRTGHVGSAVPASPVGSCFKKQRRCSRPAAQPRLPACWEHEPACSLLL